MITQIPVIQIPETTEINDQGYTPDDGNVNDTSDPDTSQGDDTGDTGDVVDDGTDTGDNSDSELDDSSSGRYRRWYRRSLLIFRKHMHK